MRTFFETANTNPMYELDVALSEYAIESADINRRINMINDTFAVNMACAEHKVLTESGCYTDLEALYEAAEEEKKKAEGGIWNSLITMINNLIAKFKKTSTEQVGKKIADEASKNPNAPVTAEGEQAPQPNFIMGILTSIGNAIKDVCSKIAKGVKESVIGEAITNLKNTISEKVKNFSLKKEGFAPAAMVMGKLSELVSTVITKIGAAGTAISNAIQNIGKNASSSMGNMLQGFVSWIISTGSTIVKTLWGTLKKAGTAIKNTVVKDKGANKDGSAGDKGKANNGAAPASVTPETTAESVNIFGLKFDTEDYTLESAFDSDCSEIEALLDRF